MQEKAGLPSGRPRLKAHAKPSPGGPRAVRGGWRRPAIVVLCATAAVVTPSNDPFSFMALAIPMVLLYEISIIVGRLLKK